MPRSVLSRTIEALTPLKERFTGSPALVFAPGPSLPKLWQGRRSDLPKICVNDAWKDPRRPTEPGYLGVIVQYPDILYASDKKWWHERKGLPDFHGGLKVSHDGSEFDDVVCLQNSRKGTLGFDDTLGLLCHGSNSGFAAVHLAAQLGANPIVLVGFDMRTVDGKEHYFGKHSASIRMVPNFSGWVWNFRELIRELNKRSIRLLNATPDSSLKIPHVYLDDVLRGRI